MDNAAGADELQVSGSVAVGLLDSHGEAKQPLTESDALAGVAEARRDLDVSVEKDENER